ncbi:MAG: GNAT family N-acetyltransferase [Acidobacteriota bacterium]
MITPTPPSPADASDPIDPDVRLLDSSKVDAFRAMTYDAYKRLLSLETQERSPGEGDHRLIEPLALGAYVDGRPAGLLVAEWPASEPTAAEKSAFGDAVPRVLSIYVSAPARRRGVAGALLDALETEVARRGGGILEAVYTTGKPPIEWLERLFAGRGWTAPEGKSLLVRFTPAAAFASRLLLEKRVARQREGLEISPFSELTAEDHETIRRSDAEKQWIVPFLAPWRYDLQNADPSSVVARHHGDVVGWVITHRPERHVVRFTCSFMRRDLAREGRIVPLYEAVLKQVRGDCRECSFTTPFEYPRMIAFIRRHLAPISHVVAETRLVKREVP